MNIGAVIKEKRQKKDLTQEQLAEYLNVSVSAVSQWESGKTTPDFSLLIPLANFFDVSLDELLGRTPGEKEKAINEYDEKDAIYASSGKVDASIALWREALARFPGDFYCMRQLMLYLFLSVCADHGNEGSEKKARECVTIGEQILRDCTDSAIREGAIQTLVYIYSAPSVSLLADEKKAIEYAEMAGDASVCRQMLLEDAYFTDESKQKRIETKHENRLYYADHLVRSLVYDNDMPKEYYLKALEAALNIWKLLIYDENYLFYHVRVSDIYSYIASMHAGNKEKKETLEAIEKALHHARKNDALQLKKQNYTSIFVSAASCNPKRFTKNYTETHTEIILKRLKHKEFDFLQNDPAFIELIKNYQTK